MASTFESASALRGREVRWLDDRPPILLGERSRGGTGAVIGITRHDVILRRFDNYARSFAVVRVPLEHVFLEPLVSMHKTEGGYA